MTTTWSFALAALGSFIATWLVCEALAAAMSIGAAAGGRTAFREQMTRQAALMLARIVVVLAVVVVAVVALRQSAPAAVIGAVLGWLLAAGRRAWKDHRATARATEDPLG